MRNMAPKNQISHRSPITAKGHIAILVVVPLSIFLILALILNCIRRTYHKRKERWNRSVRHHWADLYQYEGADPVKALVEMVPRRVSVMPAYSGVSRQNANTQLELGSIPVHRATGTGSREFGVASTSTAELTHAERSGDTYNSEYDVSDSRGQLVLDYSPPPPSSSPPPPPPPPPPPAAASQPHTHDTVFITKEQERCETGTLSLGHGAH